MDKEQIKTMALFGYSVEELPGKTIPKATYYKLDQGQVVAMPNLPADPHNMNRYLGRGFVLDPARLKAEPLPTEPQKGEPVGFTCETCGKVFSQRVALVGHKRSHKGK